MTESQLHAHIIKVVLDKISTEADRRKEALQEFFAVSLPNIEPQQSDRLAAMVPDLMPRLYDKWTTMFADRLLETIPRNQLLELCDGTANNNAAIVLIYIMFMESERMEKQIPEDLAEYARDLSGTDQDMGDLVADYLRAKMATLSDAARKTDMN